MTLADEDVNLRLADDVNRTTISNISGATWWPKLELIKVLVVKFATNKVTPVMDSIAWVRCVVPLAMF